MSDFYDYEYGLLVDTTEHSLGDLIDHAIRCGKTEWKREFWTGTVWQFRFKGKHEAIVFGVISDGHPLFDCEL